MKRFCYDGLLQPWKVRLVLQRARRFYLRDDELDDVMQELALTLLEIEYDPDHTNGAAERTVLTSVIDRQLCKMRRANIRRERHEEQVRLSGDETYDDTDVKLRLDVETLISTLGEKDRRVCRMLAQGYSKSAIAEELGYGWHTIKRMVKNIRDRFEKHGFGEQP